MYTSVMEPKMSTVKKSAKKPVAKKSPAKKSTTKVTAAVAAKLNQTPVEEPPKLVNHFAFVLDRSGSMAGSHATRAEQLYFAQTKVIQEESAKTNQKSTISLYIFDDIVEELVFAEPVATLVNQRAGFLRPRNSTALFDAVGIAIEQLSKLKDADDKNTSFLINVVTDGQENASSKFLNTISALIQAKQATDRWTIVFSVPDNHGRDVLIRKGVPAGNIKVWDATKADGLEEVKTSSSIGTRAFYSARASGAGSVKNFYTDLSKVKPSQIKKLDDLTRKYKAYAVDKECDIKAFVEEKTGKEYVPGTAFYELTKKETVQAHKGVLIREKNNKAAPIYGGDDSRSLLGLPDHGTVRLIPGNHMNYNVYVKSTSLNRKLVRGTTVLVEL